MLVPQYKTLTRCLNAFSGNLHGGVYLKRSSKKHVILSAAVLLLFLFVLVLLNLMIGSVYIPLSGVFYPTEIYREIIYIIRLPEAVGAIIVGADLAIAGAVMQSVFRNPLAEPYVTGTASGAVFGVLVGFSIGVFARSLFGFALIFEPAFGFIGAMAATALVIIFSRRGDWLSLILAGIAISILLSAFVMLLDSYLLTKTPSSLSILLLLFGTLSGLNASTDIIMALLTVPSIIYILYSSKKLNLIMISDEVAQSSGVDPGRFRLLMLVMSGVLTAAALSFTGIIGFVGLITPHIIRLMLRSANNAAVIPLAAVLGASILLLANFLSKVLIPETTVPITAITSILGVPMLMYLIKKGDYFGRSY